MILRPTQQLTSSLDLKSETTRHTFQQHTIRKAAQIVCQRFPLYFSLYNLPNQRHVNIQS